MSLMLVNLPGPTPADDFAVASCGKCVVVIHVTTADWSVDLSRYLFFSWTSFVFLCSFFYPHPKQ